MQTFSSTFIVLDYFVNTGTFAKNCVNKARPTMHCNGKCQMMKKIQEEENKEQQETERKAESKNETLSSKSFFAILPDIFFKQVFIKYTLYNDGKLVSIPHTIFHPPTALFYLELFPDCNINYYAAVSINLL